jgi:thioredoxin reductase
MAAPAAGPTGRDPYSIAGKFAPPEQRFDVVVIGAGPSGTEAAIAAAAGGASVLLVDENPVAPGLIGLDVPLYYGQRATAAVQNPARMVEQIFSANPALETALEAGVEVALGTCAWGAFVNGPGLNALPQPVVGLADEARSWLCGFERLIVATGARDLALAFPGWDQPGVMGAQALQALLTRYDAFAGRRIVILGSGALALSTALLALERGLEVAALVEVRERPQGPRDLVARVTAAGAPILTGHVVAEARGGLDGMERVTLASTSDPHAEPVQIDCDTLCLALATVPVIDLLNVAGVELAFDGARGGHVPVLTNGGETSLANIFAVGDCAGASVGAEGADYALDWTRALMAASGPEVMLCQCESVSRAALLGVEHPAYLGPVSQGMGRRDIATLTADGPINADQIKRLTRAGMGPCQGRRCREQIALTLAAATGTPLCDIPLAGYRAPVRPLPLKVLADWAEGAAMSGGWDVWFGIPSQWIPYGDIDTDREAEHVAALGGNMHL